MPQSVSESKRESSSGNQDKAGDSATGISEGGVDVSRAGVDGAVDKGLDGTVDKGLDGGVGACGGGGG